MLPGFFNQLLNLGFSFHFFNFFLFRFFPDAVHGVADFRLLHVDEQILLWNDLLALGGLVLQSSVEEPPVLINLMLAVEWSLSPNHLGVGRHLLLQNFFAPLQLAKLDGHLRVVIEVVGHVHILKS